MSRIATRQQESGHSSQQQGTTAAGRDGAPWALRDAVLSRNGKPLICRIERRNK
jgi:hypothetical protein